MWKPYSNEDFCGKVLKDMLRIDSCQPDGNEAKVVERILSLFPEGTEHKVICHSDKRQSLIIYAPGQEKTGGVALLGHLDTVPTGDASAWRHPPLGAEEEDGQIYGRGAVDMKSGDTAMIAAALNVLSLNEKPKKPISFCFTADEENGGIGARALAEEDCVKNADVLLIAEPSDEYIGVAEKGALWLKLIVSGRLAHSSKPAEGINAIENAIAFRNRLSARIDQNSEDKYLGRTTLAITKLQGGVSENMIPDQAEMVLDIRTLKNIKHADILESAEKIIKELETEIPGLLITLEVLNNRPALGINDDHDLVKTAGKIRARLGIESGCKGIFFYTDASLIIPRGEKPFLIIGPGDDALAHKRDEHVTAGSVARMAEFYTEYLMETCY